MDFEPREYQQKLIFGIFEAWANGHKNVLCQLETGAGKTVIMSSIIKNETEKVLVVAHRFDILSQISITLALHKIPHNILAPEETVQQIAQNQKLRVKKKYIVKNSKVLLASIDTILRRGLSGFNPELVVMDEAHHVIRDNKWGRVADIGKRGLFLTATPTRCDGKNLGRMAEGYADFMLCGPSMQDLIELGYLAKYRIIAPKCPINLENISVSNGDYNLRKVSASFENSTIVGDVVGTYLKFAFMCKTICFCVDIKSCIELYNAFNAKDILAEIITANTSVEDRAYIMQKFKNSKISVLINVDVLGEGTDVPEVECVILARPTKSYVIYKQQVGRCLRPAKGKQAGIIIDHVENWKKHGLPDEGRIWYLDSVPRRTSERTLISIKICENPHCMLAYEKIKNCCPFCGTKPEIKDRKNIDAVCGNLEELAPDFVSKMRAAIWEFDNSSKIPKNLPKIARLALARHRKERREMQTKLRESIKNWLNSIQNQEKNYAYKLFYLTFGIDVLSAQILNKKEAEILLTKILKQL
jgi:superfamily II DNA or RNA helicase